MGDFNSPTDSPPYAAIVADTPGLIALHDTQDISRTPHFGPTGTFTAFKIEQVEPSPIDHIFDGDGVTVLRHATLTQQERYEEGREGKGGVRTCRARWAQYH